MKEKRQTILMAVLLVLLTGYLLKTQSEKYLGEASTAYSKPSLSDPPPLPGENKVSILGVSKNSNGTYTARIEYFYRGTPKSAYFQALAIVDTANMGRHLYISAAKPERGTHALDVQVQRPSDDADIVTKKISVSLGTYDQPGIPAEMDYIIEWPDLFTYYQKIQQVKPQSIDALYKQAVSAIDEGSAQSLKTAKINLEKILLENQQYVPAYAELARVAMKTNWGPEGLNQAEKYLMSALKIDAKHANTKVLLGYVYTHQKRYQEAELKHQPLAHQISGYGLIGANF